jgi:hypothetical protein
MKQFGRVHRLVGIVSLIAVFACSGKSQQPSKAGAAPGGQGSYVTSGSIGKTAPAPIQKNDWPEFREIPPSEWGGKQILFTFNPIADTHNRDYGTWRLASAPTQDVDEPALRNKIATITDLRPTRSGDEYMVTVRVNDTGYRCIAHAFYNELWGTIFLDYVDQARHALVGKTVWLLAHKLMTYDAGSNRRSFTDVRLLSQATVLKVVASWYTDVPVRLILRTVQGEEGYLDVDVLGKTGDLPHGYYIGEVLLRSNPKLTHSWPASVWTAIETQNLIVGMTTEQVQMAWGKPASTSHVQSTGGHAERWLYPENFVDFVNGRLSAFGDLK